MTAPQRHTAGWTISRTVIDDAQRAYMRLLKRHGSIDGDVANAFRTATAMAVERCETLTALANQPTTPTTPTTNPQPQHKE
jgi:hypothetical protein